MDKTTKAKKKKSTSVNKANLTLAKITPKTTSQAKFFENYESGKHQFLLGFPGTGKTFLAFYKALKDIQDGRTPYHSIAIVRSAVPTRDVGFLPGTLEEKSEVYELPYQQICNELFGRGDAYSILKRIGAIRFITTSFIRGLTLDRTIVIADEFQNMSAHEADSVLTRGNSSSKVIFCGDVMQRDLTRSSEKDIEKFIKVVEALPEDYDITRFGIEDNVRDPRIAKYLQRKHELFPDGF